ncbi:MAG: nucleotidyl transferase AbiEii/AbiGii toxin family protein [Candidatus Scalindua sediminis]|nr:nucleotidyl transferase AbiEii/AbiGii toxin family protein [Candidatus Scalindua sediminis]
MSNISFDISGKIETSYIDALLAIKEIADHLNIPFFIVGATARDILLEHFHNIKVPRMTRDIDLGVKVPDWEKLKTLTDTMLAGDKFTKAKENQRYIYNDILIDIVPFGNISDENKTVKWPSEHEIILSTLGFDEAYEFSVLFRLSSDPLLEVKVPTIPGLAIMKLISWDEKYPDRTKDAEDLLFIMENYVEVIDQNYLYEKEATLLEEEDFDNQIACIRLLGRDIAKISNTDTLDKIKEILSIETAEQSQYRLIPDMFNVHNDFDKVLLLLNKLKQGILERKN